MDHTKNLEMEEEKRRFRSPSAMFLLFAEGCCFLLISAAVLACGFILNFHDDFDWDKVDVEIDYPQYWVGITFLITSLVAIAAGVNQKARWLVLSALSLFLICIFVSLYALVTEGNDWVQHKNAVRRKDFWDDENYNCISVLSTCICTNSQTNDQKVISPEVDCDMLKKLNYMYGGIVCCALAGVFLALSSIIVVIIFIPMQHFTVPVPTKKIKRITILEDNPRTKMARTERTAQQAEVAEVEDIVVREMRPVKRRRTVVYDEPIPQQQPEPRPALIPVEPPVETRAQEQIIRVDRLQRGETKRVISHEYDQGRLVTQPRSSPQPEEPRPVEHERKYVANPNFNRHPPKTTTYRYKQRASTVVRRTEAAPRRRRVVYIERPRVQERRLVPVDRTALVHRKRRPRAYVVERPVGYAEEMTCIDERPRAYSDEDGLVVVRERPRKYATERVRNNYRELVPRAVVQRRPRDERAGVFDGAATRRMLTEQNVAAAGPAMPTATTAHIQLPNPRGYDRSLEVNLTAADRWNRRPATPY